MNPLQGNMKKLTSLIFLILLSLSMSQCGQKGGLTRPEPTTLTTVSQ